MASPNIEHMQEVIKLASTGMAYVRLYEAGTQEGPGDFDFMLDPTEVTQLKQLFVALRNTLKGHIDAVVG